MGKPPGRWGVRSGGLRSQRPRVVIDTNRAGGRLPPVLVAHCVPPSPVGDSGFLDEGSREASAIADSSAPAAGNLSGSIKTLETVKSH